MRDLLKFFSRKNKFEIKDTGSYGRGVYATDFIKEGETIHVLSGERILEKDCDDMVAKGLIHNDDPLQISKDYYFLLDELSRTFNHNCDPNAALKGESTLFAIKDIKPGEQITYHYSYVVPSYNDTFLAQTKCECGAENCQKYLTGNIKDIPDVTLKDYLKKGALQDFIRESIDIKT
jgi:uncharacterized protein